MTSRLYIPLYDTANGGPPLGFRCAYQPESVNITYANLNTPLQKIMGPCGRVLRTERGMWSHLRSVHGIERQPGLL